MARPRAYDAVLLSVGKHFELDHFVFGPNTNLTAIAAQTDTEHLEWVIEELDTRFGMRWPLVLDRHGRMRKPQLNIPDELTVTDLAEILDSGVWPAAWVAPQTRYLD
ncbi:MAG: hypothetical protein NVV62_00865 [Terricaulis sp.]|nr:hypothetical protein [Terricaulis sp.]